MPPPDARTTDTITGSAAAAALVLDAVRAMSPAQLNGLRALLDLDRAPAVLDGWMTTAEAAVYLGLTVAALHRLTAARTVPFEQDVPGGKCWFKRSDLDDWRRGANTLPSRLKAA